MMHNSVAISKYIICSTYSLNGSVNRKFVNVLYVCNMSPFMYVNTYPVIALVDAGKWSYLSRHTCWGCGSRVLSQLTLAS